MRERFNRSGCWEYIVGGTVVVGGVLGLIALDRYNDADRAREAMDPTVNPNIPNTGVVEATAITQTPQPTQEPQLNAECVTVSKNDTVMSINRNRGRRFGIQEELELDRFALDLTSAIYTPDGQKIIEGTARTTRRLDHIVPGQHVCSGMSLPDSLPAGRGGGSPLHKSLAVKSRAKHAVVYSAKVPNRIGFSRR